MVSEWAQKTSTNHAPFKLSERNGGEQKEEYGGVGGEGRQTKLSAVSFLFLSLLQWHLYNIPRAFIVETGDNAATSFVRTDAQVNKRLSYL